PWSSRATPPVSRRSPAVQVAALTRNASARYTPPMRTETTEARRLRHDEYYRHTTLDNGLRILTGPMPDTRSVAISIYVGAGSRYEADEESGMSHLLEHLLFKGTPKRPSPQAISEAIDSVGGVVN